MNLHGTELPGVYIGSLEIHADDRGFFAEIHRDKCFEIHYVQHNIFSSKQRVQRGLHYQTIHPQGKFMMPITGSIFHAVVDLKTAKWYGAKLYPFEFIISPPSCMTGTLTLTEDSIVYEMVTEYYYPGESVSVAWDDPDIGIRWPIGFPVLKEEDANGKPFKEVFGDR
jgi:dTDP-4-dehydrorhamnose 3,5-epimerase